jgi:hypothetical protein
VEGGAPTCYQRWPPSSTRCQATDDEVEHHIGLWSIDAAAAGLLVALRALAPTERAVFLLHDVFDFSHAEIAVIVGVEASRRAVTHPAAWTTPLHPGVYPTVLRGLRNGGSPGPRHGDTVLGLPADFLIDPTGHLAAVHYGRHANDQWSVDDVITYAGRAQTGDAGDGTHDQSPTATSIPGTDQ